MRGIPQSYARPPYDFNYKLMASNLPIGVPNYELQNLFGAFGECKISIRNYEITRLATALISFESPDAAKKAKDELNFRMVGGREMLLSTFDRSYLNNLKGNVFVKNIPAAVTQKALYDLFKPFGEIFSCKIPQDYAGKSKGFGYVQFKEQEHANDAIAKLNGHSLDGKSLIVQAYKQGERKGKDPKLFNNLYVKSLPSSVTDRVALDNLFSKFGERTSVGIYQKELNGKVGFYGFVNFAKSEDAAAAVNEMHNKIIDGTQLYVAKFLTKDQREREKNKLKIESRNKSRKFTLHVKSVTGEPLTEALLKAELEQFGEIKQYSIIKRKNNEGEEVGLAVGFVVFGREEDAAKAVKEYTKTGVLQINLLEGKDQRNEKNRHDFGSNQGMEYGSMPYMGPRPMMRPQYPRTYRQQGRPRPRGMGRPPRQFMPGMEMMPYPQVMMMPYQQGRMPMNPMMNQMAQMSGMNPMGGMPPMGGMIPMPYGPMPGHPQMRPVYPMPGMMPDRPQMIQPPMAQPTNEGMPSEEPADIKQIYGERLYPRVKERVESEATAGKITGMFLELDNQSIEDLLSSEERLITKIEEAKDLLAKQDSNE